MFCSLHKLLNTNAIRGNPAHGWCRGCGLQTHGASVHCSLCKNPPEQSEYLPFLMQLHHIVDRRRYWYFLVELGEGQKEKTQLSFLYSRSQRPCTGAKTIGNVFVRWNQSEYIRILKPSNVALFFFIRGDVMVFFYTSHGLMGLLLGHTAISNVSFAIALACYRGRPDDSQLDCFHCKL